MSMKVAGSAHKHGVSRGEIIFAMTNAYVTVPGFSPARTPGAKPPTLWIGPRALGGDLVEVMGEMQAGRMLYVFHAMPLRKKFMHYLEEMK